MSGATQWQRVFYEFEHAEHGRRRIEMAIRTDRQAGEIWANIFRTAGAAETPTLRFNTNGNAYFSYPQPSGECSYPRGAIVDETACGIGLLYVPSTRCMKSSCRGDCCRLHIVFARPERARGWIVGFLSGGRQSLQVLSETKVQWQTCAFGPIADEAVVGGTIAGAAAAAAAE